MSYRRLVLHRRVLVNLVTAKAIEGVLIRQTGPLILLKDAVLHEAGEQTQMDGEVVVERERIDFIQAL